MTARWVIGVKAWRDANPDPAARAVSPVESTRVKELQDEIRRLRMENEFLKKPRPSSPGRCRSGAVCLDRGGEGQLQDQLDV
jgi:transposase